MTTSRRYLFLDDDDARHGSFRAQTIGTVVDHARSAREAMAFLSGSAAERYDTVFLDGDLDPHAAAGMTPLDPTGEEVAKFIALMPRETWPIRVVIHSLNAPRARAMLGLLEPLRTEGIEVFRAPFHAGLAAEVGL